jgi:uncharacterized protein with NRDE domain
MCLILFAFQQDPDYPLIVAANRDEFYRRPTQAAHFWPEAPRLFAGKDLQAGGTWMGVTKEGRFAAVTNYRETAIPPEHAISRGELCKNFLNSDISAANYLDQLDQKKNRYAGFNLLAGTSNELYYYSNRQGLIQAITPGVHGLSNGLLNTSWPKVETGKTALAHMLATNSSPEGLLDLLLDKKIADDDALPSTGVDINTERLLSSRFILSEHYGTRSSAALRMDYHGNIDWAEQSFNQQGAHRKLVTTRIK